MGGRAGEQAGRGGRFVKVVQDAAMCPFCQHLETTTFFEAPLPFFRSKLPWLLLGVDVQGIGVFGGSIPSGGGGVECNGGSG